VNLGVRKCNLKKYKRALLLRRTEKLEGAEIARRLGLNSRTVNTWLRERRTYGAVRVRAYHLNKYRMALRLRRDSGGILSGAAIARRLRLYPRTVSYWLKKEALCSTQQVKG
jgi:hypothetical protein